MARGVLPKESSQLVLVVSFCSTKLLRPAPSFPFLPLVSATTGAIQHPASPLRHYTVRLILVDLCLETRRHLWCCSLDARLFAWLRIVIELDDRRPPVGSSGFLERVLPELFSCVPLFTKSVSAREVAIFCFDPLIPVTDFLEGLLAAKCFLPPLLVNPELATRLPFFSSAWIQGVSGPIKLSVGLSVRVSNVDPFDKLVRACGVGQIFACAEPSGEHKVEDHPSSSPGCWFRTFFAL